MHLIKRNHIEYFNIGKYKNAFNELISRFDCSNFN